MEVPPEPSPELHFTMNSHALLDALLTDAPVPQQHSVGFNGKLAMLAGAWKAFFRSRHLPDHYLYTVGHFCF